MPGKQRLFLISLLRIFMPASHNFAVLSASILILLFILVGACGRRGDPVAIIPYKKIAVVKDLKALKRDGRIILRWGTPESRDFPVKALKGFMIFRAEVPEGKTIEECDCLYRPLDFILAESASSKLSSDSNDFSFEYPDKKALKNRSYAYKLVVMAKNNSMGNDSNIVLLRAEKKENEKAVIITPGAPARLTGVYTPKGVVLTWDKVQGQEIKFYRIHRSDGNGFSVIGETATNAFTDTNIELSRKYFYRLTAVGNDEGPPSEEFAIEIKTLGH